MREEAASDLEPGPPPLKKLVGAMTGREPMMLLRITLRTQRQSGRRRVRGRLEAGREYESVGAGGPRGGRESLEVARTNGDSVQSCVIMGGKFEQKTCFRYQTQRFCRAGVAWRLNRRRRR